MFNDRSSERVAKKAARDAAMAAQQLERDQAAFRASPVGQAALAYDRGYRVFQTSLELHRITNAVEVLNAICEQGWELINGSVSTDGTGYYLFRRADIASPTQHIDPPDAIAAQQPSPIAEWRRELGRRLQRRTR
jgi:hypothetical protein